MLSALSERLVRPPDAHTDDPEHYVDWRSEALANSWKHFDDALIRGRDVVDFGSGKGNLVFFLAGRGPRSVTGVELHAPSVDESRARAKTLDLPDDVDVRFVVGAVDHVPLDDASADVLCAFDVVEHVMNPEHIVSEWRRVLRPGGKVLIDWCPWRSPWAPHMESLVPVPWAHIVFGEEALFRTCEAIYESPKYVHRPWDLDDRGNRLPNKWRQWRSFREQGYINQLNVEPFKDLARAQGFEVTRFEHVTFGSLPARDVVGPLLMRLPVVNELMCSYVIGELTRR